MTIKNLTDEQNKKNRPIIISDDKDKTIEYLCKYCNCVIKGKFTEDSIFCVHCQTEIYLDKDTRKALKSVKAHNTLFNITLKIWVDIPNIINPQSLKGHLPN
jgi:hypothetical protein